MTLSASTLTRRLVLLRHASAEFGGGGADSLRPLAMSGRRQASAVGRGLTTLGIAPELVFCSDAVRTQQTWDLLRAGLGEIQPEVVVTAALYPGDIGAILALVNEVDDRVRTVLVVAHEPAVSAVAGYLAGEGSEQAALTQVQVGVPTGSFSVLDGAEPWSRWDLGTAQLTMLVRTDV